MKREMKYFFFLAALSVELTRAGRWEGGTSLSHASKTGFYHHHHPHTHTHTHRRFNDHRLSPTTRHCPQSGG